MYKDACKRLSALSLYCAPGTMRRCKHYGLIDIASSDHPCLVDSFRLQRLVEGLSDPDQQYPVVVTCFGAGEKSLAIDQLFPANKSGGVGTGIYTTYVDVLTATDRYPILFINADIKLTPANEETDYHCHQSRAFRLAPQLALDNLSATLARQLLIPFSSILCMFAADLGGLKGVLERLQVWSEAVVQTEPRQTRLIVVVGDDERIVASDAYPDLLARLEKLALLCTFSSVRIETVSGAPLRNVRYVALREAVLGKELEAARQGKQACMTLYSATHVAALFSACITHTARSPKDPFDFFWASRRGIPCPPYFGDCLNAFLKAAYQHGMPHRTLASVLGTSLLMQAYPSSSHHFSPQKTFSTMYNDALAQAFETTLECSAQFSKSAAYSVLRQQMVGFVHREFIAGWEMMRQDGISASALHRSRLQDPTIQSHAKSIFSYHFCSICVLQRPEHILKCRHAICDVCARAFGDARVSEEYAYSFMECPYCGASSNLLIRLKPPTAGVRILSIDGGGVRGIVPLEFLNLLQQSLGASWRVQDCFDLALGTSAGGLVVLGMFGKQWNAEDSLQTFRHLAGRFFTTALSQKFPSLARARTYVRCIIRDCCYKSEALNHTLKESFGEDTRMFDYPDSGVSRVKIAVTTTTTATASTRVITNYNGISVAKARCGYRSIRPEDQRLEPLMWQAGRATSAAPGLFSPCVIPNIGTFQDGALRHNNLVNVALWESTRIWPRDTPKDVVLSLGTGMNITPSPQTTTAPRTLNDKFIPRLCRSFLAGLDGELTWRDLLNHLEKDDQRKFFRLNIQLESQQLRLDDVTAIDKLSKDIHLAKDDYNIVEIKLALLAASFFFELRCTPKFDSSGFYVCQGNICVRGDPKKVFTALRQLSSGEIDFYKDSTKLGTVDTDTNICQACTKFRKKICFFVRHPSKMLLLTIRMGSLRHHISGFP